MTTETHNQTTHTMPQLIFSDIDGTLIPVRTAILPNHTAQAIRAVTQSGVAFALNTGRQYGFVRPAFAPLLDDIYIICQSGSTIYHRDKLLVHHFLPHKLCLRLEKMLGQIARRLNTSPLPIWVTIISAVRRAIPKCDICLR